MKNKPNLVFLENIYKELTIFNIAMVILQLKNSQSIRTYRKK